MRFKFLTVLALALLASPALADEASSVEVLATFEQKGQDVAIYKFGEVLADGGDMDAFAAKVAPHLRSYTAKEGVEACALICRSPAGAWGATLITINAAAVCPRTTACPIGMTPTETDIHSHIHESTYRPSELDKLFLSRTYRRGDQVATVPDRFSPADFAGGEGYMVSRRLLQHQAGARRVRVVAGP